MNDGAFGTHANLGSMMGLPSEEAEIPAGYRLSGSPGKWKHVPGGWRPESFTTTQEAIQSAWNHHQRVMDRESHR